MTFDSSVIVAVKAAIAVAFFLERALFASRREAGMFLSVAGVFGSFIAMVKLVKDGA